MIFATGSCLCERARYEVQAPPISRGICYCLQCRKSGGMNGSPLLVLAETSLKISADCLSTYQTESDDGSVVRRVFCSNCGSHLFAKIAGVPGIVTVRAATLNGQDRLLPDYLAWTSAAGPNSIFPSGVRKFPGDPPLEVVLKPETDRERLKR